MTHESSFPNNGTRVANVKPETGRAQTEASGPAEVTRQRQNAHFTGPTMRLCARAGIKKHSRRRIYQEGKDLRSSASLLDLSVSPCVCLFRRLILSEPDGTKAPTPSNYCAIITLLFKHVNKPPE